MYRQEVEVHGVPLWLVRDYLHKLGGQPVAENTFVGPGWQVRVRQGKPTQVGSLRVGVLYLAIETENEAGFAAFFPQLDRMLMRGGG